MKYIKIAFLICAMISVSLQSIYAQGNKIDVTINVLDVQGNAISGAIVTNDKDGAKAVSDEAGMFSVTVPTNSMLTIKAIGYEMDKVSAKAGVKSVVLKVDNSSLVQVAFKKMNKEDILGGVSKLDVPKLLENVYYTSCMDNLSSYIPGYSFGNGGFIWGQSTDQKMILVDGIPRENENIIPSEIEQITVLKSAAAIALYGSRAARGVISITTKRGVKNGNDFRVIVNSGIFVPKRNPHYLHSADYMKLYNEALTNDNDGVAPASGLYSDADIAGSTTRSNPYRYPDVDFYSSDYLKSFSNRTDVTTEYSGGSERARFYANIGYYNTNTLLNFGNAKKSGEDRFNVRANLDLKLSNIITSRINTSATVYDSKGTQGSYWDNASKIRPNQFSPLLPISYMQNADAQTKAYIAASSFLIDGKYLLGGISTQQTNPFADILTRGYTQYSNRQYQFDATTNFDLTSVLKGLTFETQFGVDYKTSYNQSIGDNSYAVYAPTWADDANISTLTKISNDNRNNSRGISDAYDRQTLFLSAAFKYNNTFSKVHNVSVMLLAHAYKISESEKYHATSSNANLGLQVSYNYKQKYYADLTTNAVHSVTAAPGHRDAISPTVSAGWRISSENFFQNIKFVNDLKLTASAGILHTDIDYSGYYLYKGVYSTDNGSYFSWQEGRQLRSTDVTRGENLNLGLAKRKEVSVGLEATLFDKSLQLTGSYYLNQMIDIPVQSGSLYPNYLGKLSGYATNFLPYINYNRDQRSGFDISANYNKQIQKVNLNIGLVASYYKTKALLRSENDIADAYQKRQGRSLDALWGLKSLGFYKDAADIANSPTQAFGQVKPGDIKYQDINNDGVVNAQDEVYLGRKGDYGTPLSLGLNIAAKWNNFTIFILANAGVGGKAMKDGSYYWAKDGTTAKYSEVMLGRWTPATAETATYPRLTTTGGSNNYRNSDFWMYKTDRISLSKIQLSYCLPKALVSKVLINDATLFVNANDVLLIAKEKKWMETTIGNSPQTRYYSLGIKVAF
jgi:TonB-linked SusC/RagA family outer membrane protein